MVMMTTRAARWRETHLNMGKITGVKLPTILDDLKWCFDTPASTVVELALKRLGIPAFYANP